MSDEPELRKVSSLMALEFLMIDTLSARYLASPDPVAAAKAHRKHLRQVLSELSMPTVGGMDWALVIDEMGNAIDRIVEEAGQNAARRMEERRQP
jgi:hypothetical protein